MQPDGPWGFQKHPQGKREEAEAQNEPDRSMKFPDGQQTPVVVKASDHCPILLKMPYRDRSI
jgi:hypothetical protein